MTAPIGIFQKILVPIDGSEKAKKALDQALQLAKIHDSDVEILHVMILAEDLSSEPETPVKIDTPSEWIEESLTKIRVNAKKMLSEAVEEASNIGLDGRVTSKLLVGNPVDLILREAEEGSFDLIVIGDRGLSGLKEFVLGSVSHQVVDHSKIPVLVVK